MTAPERPLLQPAALLVAGEIAANPRLVPKERGIYGWWFDDILAAVPREGCYQLDTWHLLYIGIAPSGANLSSKRTLRDRLKNHCRGPIRHSTLRRTLAALVGQTLGLVVARRPDGKLSMSQEDEACLTGWMSDHARVGMMIHPEPWTIESKLVATGCFPLNVAGSTNTFRAELAQLRATLGRYD